MRDRGRYEMETAKGRSARSYQPADAPRCPRRLAAAGPGRIQPGAGRPGRRPGRHLAVLRRVRDSREHRHSRVHVHHRWRPGHGGAHRRVLVRGGWFYQAVSHPGAFYDITIGNNDLANVGCCQATVGYDLASGLGVPNWAVLPATLPSPG